MRKMYYEVLPKGGANRGDRTNWKKSVGYDVNFIYKNTVGVVKILSYVPSYINIKYLDKEPFRINIDNFKDCRLGNLLGYQTSEFKVKLGEIIQDKVRNITITGMNHTKNDKNRNWKIYNYKCNICGYEGKIEESNLLKGEKCSCCSNKTIVYGINDITTTAPFMIPFFQNPEDAKLYMKSSNKMIFPICPDCKRIKSKPMMLNTIYRVHGIYCNCGDGQSYPFKFVFNLMEQLNAIFKTEYPPKWCKFKIKGEDKTGRYDFHFELNKKEYIIETDGAQHKKDKSKNSHWLSLEEQNEIDDYKDSLAKEHNIKMIRIDCEKSELEYIKNSIIHSKLYQLFDLTNIDWLKCHEFACSNRVKEVCNYKLQNNNMSCNDIAKVTKISGSAIRNYLKKGTILGWCNYDIAEERKNSDIRMSKFRNKQVEVYKDGMFLGVYPSIKELTRKSEEIYKVKFTTSGISGVCHGRHKLHRKYNFKFVNITQPKSISIISPIITIPNELAITSITTIAS